MTKTKDKPKCALCGKKPPEDPVKIKKPDGSVVVACKKHPGIELVAVT